MTYHDLFGCLSILYVLDACTHTSIDGMQPAYCICVTQACTPLPSGHNVADVLDNADRCERQPQRLDWTLAALVGMGPGGPRRGRLARLVINARNGQALHYVICHPADDHFRSVAVRSSLMSIADSLCGYHTASPPTVFRHRFPALPSSHKDGGTGHFIHEQSTTGRA